MKTHLTSPITGKVTCAGQGNNRLKSADTSRVSCLNCRKSPEFQTAREAQIAAHDAAVAAQTPTTVANPWGGPPIVCGTCANGTFRYDGRSLDYHRYLCAQCGAVRSVITESGMSA